MMKTKVDKSVCACVLKDICIHIHIKARRLSPKCLKFISSLNGRVISHLYFLSCVHHFLNF